MYFLDLWFYDYTKTIEQIISVQDTYRNTQIELSNGIFLICETETRQGKSGIRCRCDHSGPDHENIFFDQETKEVFRNYVKLHLELDIFSPENMSKANNWITTVFNTFEAIDGIEMCIAYTMDNSNGTYVLIEIEFNNNPIIIDIFIDTDNKTVARTLCSEACDICENTRPFMYYSDEIVQRIKQHITQ